MSVYLSIHQILTEEHKTEFVNYVQRRKVEAHEEVNNALQEP